jgi:hypothetical protein
MPAMAWGIFLTKITIITIMWWCGGGAVVVRWIFAYPFDFII